MNVRLLTCLCGVALVLLVVPALAQESTDPVETARIHLGPFGLTPSASLSNIGVDSNVFNTVEDPRRDFTMTVAPRLDTWFRAGRTLTSIGATTDFVYFHTYASERSVDASADGRLEVPGNRFQPWVAGGFSTRRQRVGYEIDARSRRRTTSQAFGVDVRVGARTTLGVSAQRTDLSHDADLFLGVNLQTTLNRTTDSLKVDVRRELSVLTTVVIEGEAMRDRFTHSPERDSDTVRILAGFDLDERALIGGNVRLGYRKFDGVGGGVSSFTGFVASFTTGITVRGRTRVTFEGNRDVNYSFETLYPSYVLMGATLTLTPRFTTQWDAQARVGGQRLGYRAAIGAGAILDRVDRYTLLGAGIGRYFGREIRVGFNLDHERRFSPIQRRRFDGFRFGTSVTYGR